MNRTIFITGVLFGALAVILGAFGAHGLEKLLDDQAISTFETGVEYQMYHGLLLLVLANTNLMPELSKKWVFYIIMCGTILFSLSIYLLATNSLTGFDFNSIAYLTPLGGTLLIVGWALLGYRTFKYLN